MTLDPPNRLAASTDEAEGASGTAGEEDGLPALQATTLAERKRGFQILFVCLLSVGMGQSLFFAVLPPIARDLGMTEFQTSMTFSLSALLWVLTSAFWGGQSDYIGRKAVLLMGLLGFAVSMFAFAIVVSLGLAGLVSLGLMFPLLISARAIFGAFSSGTMPAAQAYVADRTTRVQRASGVAQVGAAFGLGTVVGPGFAAVMTTVHILAPFYAVSVLALGSTLLIWRALPERTPPKTKISERKRRRLRLTDPRVLPFLILGVLISLALSTIMQLTAFYLMDMMQVAGNEATQLISVGFMSMSMSMLFAQLGLVQRFNFSVQFLLRWGSAIMVFAYCLLVLGGSYGVLVSAMALAGLGFGLLRPGLMAGASLSVSPDEQGGVAGLVGATVPTGHVLTPFVGIPLYHLSPELPFLLGAGLMLAVLVFSVLHPVIRNIRATVEEEDTEVHPH